jgi:tol-pal system protein YbgF
MSVKGSRERRSLLFLGARLCALAAGLLLFACATPYEVRRVSQDQKEVRGMVADLQVAVDKLRREVAVLQSETEQLGGGGRGGRGSASLPDLERRLAVVENRLKLIEQGQPAGAVAAPATPSAAEQPGLSGGVPPLAAMATPTATPRAADTGIARDEAALASATVDERYRDAFGMMRRGRYSEAIPGFREFLRTNPKSEFADDAQYYIGESYYATKDYNRAILEFNEVLLKYPKGEKVPAALLRQANAFAELGDKVDARLILQKLVGEYPRSEEAARGRQLLEQMGQ